MKKRDDFLKCIGIVFAVLLLLMLCGCSKKTSQNAAITLPEQETSPVGQAGAIFAPSTEFVSADAAGEYSYTKLPIKGYRVRGAVSSCIGAAVFSCAAVCWHDQCCSGTGILFYADNSVAEAVPPRRLKRS